LSQVRLIISPFYKPPQAVTLPINYNKLPTTLPPQVEADEVLRRICQDSEGFIGSLDGRRNERLNSYKDWKSNVDRQETEEQRKIAPGYLDTTERILQPTRNQAHSIEEQPGAEPEPKAEDQVNEIDQIFGHVNIN
jgi:hypothetical protein